MQVGGAESDILVQQSCFGKTGGSERPPVEGHIAHSSVTPCTVWTNQDTLGIVCVCARARVCACLSNRPCWQLLEWQCCPQLQEFFFSHMTLMWETRVNPAAVAAPRLFQPDTPSTPLYGTCYDIIGWHASINRKWLWFRGRFNMAAPGMRRIGP